MLKTGDICISHDSMWFKNEEPIELMYRNKILQSIWMCRSIKTGNTFWESEIKFTKHIPNFTKLKVL